MRSVVGVDFGGRSDSAIAWIGRLRFQGGEAVLVHATEPLPATFTPEEVSANVEAREIRENLHRAGISALVHATRVAKEHRLQAQASHLEGVSTSTLRQCAESVGANLIAVTSTLRSSHLGATFGGGVARGLAISAKQSILVARESMPRDRPLRVVFAIDHSHYCDECVETLARFSPRGLARLTLLTVIDRGKRERPLSLPEHFGASTLVENATKFLIHRGAKVAEGLTKKGIPSTSRVIAGEVQETVHTVMNETDADLLILGAQGHGYAANLSIGNTSLHQVVSERYPVLLLRPSLQPLSAIQPAA